MKLNKRAKRKNTIERYRIYYCDCNCNGSYYFAMYEEKALEYNKHNDPPMPLM